MSIYTNAKSSLKEIAKKAKEEFGSDKPAIIQTINDTADSLCKDFPASLTDAKREQYTDWLHSYAVKLHP